LVFTDEYKKWTTADVVLIKKDLSIAEKNEPAVNYVETLFKI
jgi:hypothetical protein